MQNYIDINSKAIDKWVEEGWEWGVPVTREDFAKAKRGVWSVLLTPKKPVPVSWFAPLFHGGTFGRAKILGLASGGGQQMPIFAALGAECAVFDNSERQLESERMVSLREGYSIDIVKGDMTKPLPFESGSFDLIFHPVSNCYIEDVRHVWRECWRLLKSGGILLSGMDYGLNYIVEDENPCLIVNKLPFNPLKDEDLYARCLLEDGSIQFSHTIEEQVGGQMEAGFVLTGLYEDTDGSGIGEYIPNYVATRAVKMQ